MKQKIVAYHKDEFDDWVAELECHHGQHVRHEPPFINRLWVVNLKGRNNNLGNTLNCVKCDENAPKDSW